MQLIPAIDLLGNDAVRLEQGDYTRVLFRQPLSDFFTRVVATGPDLIHVVDLQGSRDGVLRPEVIARCAQLAGDVPLQFSGGIRSLEAAREVLAAGAARVILGTAVWSAPEALAHFVEELGEKLVVAFDVRDGLLAVRGWLASTGLSVDDALVRCQRAGVSRLHVTAIARDGTMSGPDLELYRRVCAGGLHVVAAGGVRGDQDLADLSAIGCEAAVMGVGFLARLGIVQKPDVE